VLVMADDNDKTFTKVMNSPTGRHVLNLGVTLAGVGMMIGVTWTTLEAKIERVNRDFERHVAQNVKDWELYRAANTSSLSDVRERLRAAEVENVKDREARFALEKQMTEMNTNIVFIRQAVERLANGPR
jgi:hypothetical protein